MSDPFDFSGGRASDPPPTAGGPSGRAVGPTPDVHHPFDPPPGAPAADPARRYGVAGSRPVRWSWIAGGALALALLAVGVVVFAGSAGPPDGPSSAGVEVPGADAFPAGSVTYEVTGPGRAAVTYSAGAAVPVTTTTVALPFQVVVAPDGEPSLYTVVARGPGTLACSVTRDGTVLDRRSADGPSATVTCSTS